MTYYRHTINASYFFNWSNFAKDHQYNRQCVILPGGYLNFPTNAILQMRSCRDPSPNGNRGVGVADYDYNIPCTNGIYGASRATFFAALTTPNPNIDPITPPIFSTRVDPAPMPWKVAPTKGHLKGFIYGETTNNPIDGVSFALSGPLARASISDATGFYGSVDLTPGVYTLNVSSPGYLNYSTHVTISTNVATCDVILSVFGPLVITNQPVSQTVVAGSNATFSVGAAGTPPLRYQWRLEGIALPGATDSTLTLNSVQPSQAGNYSVVVSNSAASLTSSNALLTINYALNVTVAGNGSVVVTPAQSSYSSNATVSLRATANSGASFLGWSGDVTGTNNPVSLTMSANKAVMAGFSGGASDIIIDNSDPGFKTSGSWTIGTMSADKYGADYSYATATTGAANAFATYTPTMTVPGYYDVYIWYPQGSNRSTNAPWTVYFDGGSCTTTVNQRANGGGWRLIAAQNRFSAGTNGYVRLANNAAATVVMADAVKLSYSAVQAPPSIQIQPQSQRILAGQTVSFSAVSTTAGPLNWQWLKNGYALTDAANVSGSDSHTLTLSNVTQADAATYAVALSNVLGMITSSNALLTVIIPPRLELELSAGYPLLNLDGMLGNNFVVQYRTNLAGTNWTHLFSLTNLPSSPYPFLDSGAVGQPARFYRAFMQ